MLILLIGVLHNMILQMVLLVNSDYLELYGVEHVVLIEQQLKLSRVLLDVILMKMKLIPLNILRHKLENICLTMVVLVLMKLNYGI